MGIKKLLAKAKSTPKQNTTTPVMFKKRLLFLPKSTQTSNIASYLALKFTVMAVATDSHRISLVYTHIKLHTQYITRIFTFQHIFTKYMKDHFIPNKKQKPKLTIILIFDFMYLIFLCYFNSLFTLTLIEIIMHKLFSALL